MVRRERIAWCQAAAEAKQKERRTARYVATQSAAITTTKGIAMGNVGKVRIDTANRKISGIRTEERSESEPIYKELIEEILNEAGNVLASGPEKLTVTNEQLFGAVVYLLRELREERGSKHAR